MTFSLLTRLALTGLLLTLAACADAKDDEATPPANNDPGPDPNPDMMVGDLSVSAISPDTGSPSGGTTVIVSGTGFVDGMTVTIGAAEATGVSLLSPTQISALTPAATAGRVDITLRRPDGQTATLPSSFEYLMSIPNAVDWCALQFPPALQTAPDAVSAPVFGRVYDEGCTNGDAQCEAITGQLGFGPLGGNPEVSPETFTWINAAYNNAHTEDDNDEYTAAITATVGTYNYTYRFSVDGGQQWTYCDLDGTDNGFQVEQMGTLTVEEDILAISWCALQFPAATAIAPGGTTEPFFGRVFADGCTNGAEQCAPIRAQVGAGPRGIDPATAEESFAWTDAAYNDAHTEDDNDEYTAAITLEEAGEYGYAFRFALEGDDTWRYCDLDGTDNGFQVEQMGALTVEEDVLSIGWCTIQAPSTLTIEPGQDTEPIFGRVFAEGCTDGDAQCEGLRGQLGLAPRGTNPIDDPDAVTWVDGAYNDAHTSDNNDEYSAAFTAVAEGLYSYVWRFSADDGANWTVCDLDSTDNGFQVDQMGFLTVENDDPAETVDWCQIQFPAATETVATVPTDLIFGQVFVAECTGQDEACAGVVGQLGFGDLDLDPSANPEVFTWADTTFNAEHSGDNNDEYFGTITPVLEGTFSYVYRFSIDGEQTWTYCDTNGDDGFQSDQLGTLTVANKTIEWCNIQFPTEIDATPGEETALIYGRVFSPDCTNGANQCVGLLSQVGFGAQDTDPSATPESFEWFAAEYNAAHISDDNDEYQGALLPTEAGTFSYAYRFSGDGGQTWAYCDTSGAPFDTEDMGTLNATAD